jgi:Txe/YoeB family toxin of Txe-Axe toxin-antitoxin module
MWLFLKIFIQAYIDKLKKKLGDLEIKDFAGLNLEQIKTALIIQTTIHEAKHKVDEYELPKVRLNLDREISAYLTEAIFSPCPFNDLISTINQVEGFSRNFNSRTLDKMLEQLNILEAASIKDNYTPEQLKAELRKIYSNYRTIDGNKRFIDLTEFENIVVTEIYRVFR